MERFFWEAFLFYMLTTIISPKKTYTPRVPREAKPFYFHTGRKAIFFVHGFTDSLCRVNTFAKFLSEKGITTKGVLLPGHGQTWHELAQTTPNDWYAEVEKGILEMSREVKEVYVVGISFGGNLALKFAAEHPGVVRGIVTVESPMAIKRQQLVKMGIPFFMALGWPYWNKKFLRKINHPEKDRIFRQGVLDKMPIINIAQVIDFLERRQRFLSKVTCDVLIIQSKTSNIIVHDSANLFYKKIKSPRKEIMWIDNFYHAILNEKEKRRIFMAATEFFGIKV